MGEKEARAVAARETVQVNGSEYRVSPLNVRQLQEIQRAALQDYKQQCLQLYINNRDVLPADLLERKVDEISKWDMGNLPIKIGYATDKVPLTEAVITLLVDKFPRIDISIRTERERKSLLEHALDQGQVTASEVKDLSGIAPEQARIRYDIWWLSTSFEAMALFVREAIAPDHPEVTKDDIAKWPVADLINIANVAQKITAPSLGNE